MENLGVAGWAQVFPAQGGNLLETRFEPAFTYY